MSRDVRRVSIYVLPIVVIASLVGLQLRAMDRPGRTDDVAPVPADDEADVSRIDRLDSYPRDYWVTVSDDPESPTYQDMTVPAGFFGPACEAFEERVYFEGRPLDQGATGRVDTVLRRSADPILQDDPVGTVGTVSLELEELSLVSIDPITVMCDGEPQDWMVHVGLSPAPVPTGSMTATKTHAGGGTFDTTIYVQPLFTFTNVEYPDRVLVLDTANVSDPAELAATGGPFVYDVPAEGGGSEGKYTKFVPGIAGPIPGARPSQVEKVRHEAPGHEHCVEPPEGACCGATGSCTVKPAAECVGVYMGDDTACGPTGACCLAGGTCVESYQICCGVLGGTFEGSGTVCYPNPCEPPVEDIFCSTADITVTIDEGVMEEWPDGFTDTLFLSSEGLGDSVVVRTAPPYDDCFDGDCLPPPCPEIDTEITNLELAGYSPNLGNILVLERDDVVSDGGICCVDTDSDGEFISGDSYFNIFVEIEVLDYDITLDTGDVPVRLQAEGITQLPPFGDSYIPQPPTSGVCDQPGGPQTILLYLEGTTFQVGEITHALHQLGCCQVEIDECRDLCVDEEFVFSAQGSPGGGTYEWSVIQPGNQLTPTSGSGQTFTVSAQEVSLAEDDVTVKVIYTAPDGTRCNDECKLTVLDCEFVEDPTEDYGFDAYTNKDNDPVVPYKSVETSEDDIATLNIAPPTSASHVHIISSDAGKVTVAPAVATASPQTVTVTGVAKGTSDITARATSAVGSICATMTTTAYDELTKTVAVVLVHEDNDDVEQIPVGQGKPNTVAITAGPDGVLDTTPAGDDQVVGNTITTGADGVCDSTAVGDDVQAIPLGNGKPNEICVKKGDNNFRDTNPAGDDVVNGDDIDTGPDGICDTAPNNTDVLSTDVGTAAAIQTYLNETVYNQAVVSWTVTKLAAVTTNFDLNRDGVIDVDSWMSDEMKEVRDAAKDDTKDHNIFLVDNPSDGSYGFMAFGQRYGFVHPDTSPAPNTTIAHELGHGAFSLTHESGLGIPVNLMTQGPQEKWRLFKGQWDTVNP